MFQFQLKDINMVLWFINTNRQMRIQL